MKVQVRRSWTPTFTMFGLRYEWEVLAGVFMLTKVASFAQWDHAIFFANAYARALRQQRRQS